LGYNLTLKTKPAIEPVTIAEATNYLRIDLDPEDTEEINYLESIIATAREWCEGFQKRAYITQTWEMTLDYWTYNIIEIPKGSLQSIVSIKYKDSLGVETPLVENTDFVYSKRGILGRVTPAYGKSWPSFTPYPLDAITIEFKCGYGDTADKVPEKVIQAMKLLISHWYENRTPLSDTRLLPKELDFTVSALLGMDRIYYA
jgi:uncharacterized phiE125 gp8 family phage protein